MHFVSHKFSRGGDSYTNLDQLDFQIIPTGIKKLPFFNDDVFLGMQAMNVGLIDQLITQYEYELLRIYNEIERTPDSTMAVSALSQMWIFALYEVLRMWANRKFTFAKLLKDGGIAPKKLNSMSKDSLNHTLNTRKQQMLRFKDDLKYREEINSVWEGGLEDIYLATALIRINLAKHCAPGKDNMIPMSPGSARINDWCGALDFQLIEKNKNYPQINSDSYYTSLSRRDIADALRDFLIKFA